MNNPIRTILDILTMLVLVLTAVGCSVDDPLTLIVEPTVCAIPFLSPAINVGIALGLQGIGFIMKGMRPGGPFANWFGKTVAVVAPMNNVDGTVTANDVKRS